VWSLQRIGGSGEGEKVVDHIIHGHRQVAKVAGILALRIGKGEGVGNGRARGEGHEMISIFDQKFRSQRTVGEDVVMRRREDVMMKHIVLQPGKLSINLPYDR